MDIDEMIAKAMENSVTIKSLEINRENTLLNRQISDVDDVVSITIKSGDVTIRREDQTRSEAIRDPFLSFGPSVDITLPEFNDSTVSFGVRNTTKITYSGNATATVTPYASYKKTINLDSFTDTRDEISKRSNELKLDQSYQKNILQFKNSFLQNVVSIMQSQLSVESQQIAYDRMVADYESSLASGDITDGNVKDMQAKMNIDNKRVSLENSKEKLDKALESFKKNYGFDFEAPETVRVPNLDFHPSDQGNTNVLLAGLVLETAKQAVSAAEGTSNKFQIGADASTQMIFKNKDNTDPTITADASVSGTLTGANYSIGAESGASYRASDQELFPYITFRGTWKNKTTTVKDNLNLQTLRNKVILAQMDYDDALLEYQNNSANIQASIQDFFSSLKQVELNLTYDAMIAGITAEMHESGLATDRELEDAKIKVNSDKKQLIIQNINGLIIENNIAINEL